MAVFSQEPVRVTDEVSEQAGGYESISRNDSLENHNSGFSGAAQAERGREGFAMSKRVREENTNDAGCTLYVSNLSDTVTEAALKQFFEDIGETVECQIVFNPITKASRGFGFIRFESHEKAGNAVETYDGREIQGRKIVLAPARRKGPHDPTPGYYKGPVLNHDRPGRGLMRGGHYSERRPYPHRVYDRRDRFSGGHDSFERSVGGSPRPPQMSRYSGYPSRDRERSRSEHHSNGDPHTERSYADRPRRYDTREPVAERREYGHHRGNYSGSRGFDEPPIPEARGERIDSYRSAGADRRTPYMEHRSLHLEPKVEYVRRPDIPEVAPYDEIHRIPGERRRHVDDRRYGEPKDYLVERPINTEEKRLPHSEGSTYSSREFPPGGRRAHEGRREHVNEGRRLPFQSRRPVSDTRRTMPENRRAGMPRQYFDDRPAPTDLRSGYVDERKAVPDQRRVYGSHRMGHFNENRPVFTDRRPPIDGRRDLDQRRRPYDERPTYPPHAMKQ